MVENQNCRAVGRQCGRVRSESTMQSFVSRAWSLEYLKGRAVRREGSQLRANSIELHRILNKARLQVLLFEERPAAVAAAAAAAVSSTLH